MDFIDGLPRSGGKDVIWVIVDRLSKYVHFIALIHPMTAVGLAKVFIDQFYCLYGAPVDIVSDHDPLHISHFWKEFVG